MGRRSKNAEISREITDAYFKNEIASCTMAPGFTQRLTQMSTRRFMRSKARPERKADNLTAIYEPIAYTMWDP
jgi:hypothetical protein